MATSAQYEKALAEEVWRLFSDIYGGIKELPGADDVARAVYIQLITSSSCFMCFYAKFDGDALFILRE
jgi:hypothetical protein